MFYPEFVEMLAALSEARAEFLVVGGYAFGVHGEPRATKDLDLLVRPSPANARRVWAALGRFGAPRFDLEPKDLERPGLALQIGVPPKRIDLLTSITAVDFVEAWRSRILVPHPHLPAPIPVLGRAALIRNKRAVGRPQDLVDVAQLEATAKRRRSRTASKRR